MRLAGSQPDAQSTEALNYKLIELEYEQIDAIVIGELKIALEAAIDAEEYDGKIIDALKTVLRYYMPYSDYESYIRDLALTELVREDERLGLYDDGSTK